jgi:CheY-like chemotaxis protein
MDTGPWLDDASAGRPLRDSQREGLARPVILVTEDDPDILELLAILLEQAGFACVPARTAEEGLEHLREGEFDLVLTDYSLPTRSGTWMLNQATEEGLLASTPVLVVTAHPDPDGVERFEVIRKPFDLDQLVGRVKQRLDGGTPRWRATGNGKSGVRSARRGGGGADDRKPIELILYVSAHSPRSASAIANLKRALARYQPSRIQLTICDLARDPSLGVSDSVAFTPTLVKRSPGPRTFILGHLSNPDLLFELIDGCDS